MRTSRLIAIALGSFALGACSQPVDLGNITTGSILPSMPAVPPLPSLGPAVPPLALAGTNGSPRRAERVSGNLYRIDATDRQIDDPDQRASYTLLRAAEGTKEAGATHFIVVDTVDATAARSGGQAALAPKGGLIRVFLADSDRLPPTGSISADEIIQFFGPTFDRPATASPVSASQVSASPIAAQQTGATQGAAARARR